MILEFDDACWTHDNDDWKRSLIRLLVALETREQHAVLATPNAMLIWCEQYLRLSTDYFKTRVGSAQARANALELKIHPSGANVVSGSPPWTLNADTACGVVERPLRLVVENDMSDTGFVATLIPSFPSWHSHRWVEPVMAGGNPMLAKIKAASANDVERWRTFFMFDSDRLHPDEFLPSWVPPKRPLDACQGHEFETACAGMPRERWYRLRRRSIENYLPEVVLRLVDPTATDSLFSDSVGQMAHYYNMKTGLSGDGVFPANPNKSVRAARSQGFWLALPTADQRALERGYDEKIAKTFANVPLNHAWHPDVIAEMTALSDAIQDAM